METIRDKEKHKVTVKRDRRICEKCDCYKWHVEQVKDFYKDKWSEEMGIFSPKYGESWACCTDYECEFFTEHAMVDWTKEGKL